MRRQGEAMRVEVVQPRWAGTLSEEVHWAGQIVVDGDLRVAPEGELIIHENNRVRFAGTDRLQSGRDPQRSELEVHGVLRIFRSLGSEKVVFEALNPGETWYGILIHLADSSRLQVPGDSYDLRDTEHGILLPGAPVEAGGQVSRSYRLVDASGPETAGNGDGQLSPGESFLLSAELDNWSLATYEKIQASLRWHTPLGCRRLRAGAPAGAAGIRPSRLDRTVPIIGAWPRWQRTLR